MSEKLDEGCNFALDLIIIEGLHTKLWAPKVKGIPAVGILRLPLGNPGTKCHLDVGLMEKYKVYYKGEGGGFPLVRAVVSLVNMSLLVALKHQKCSNYALTNFLFGLCRSM